MSLASRHSTNWLSADKWIFFYSPCVTFRCFPSQSPPPPPAPPSGRAGPEQRSFKDRQKYFEIDVKQQTPDKPKPRVSLVGADDLKKMREEEGLSPSSFFFFPPPLSLNVFGQEANERVDLTLQRGSLSSGRGSTCWMKTRTTRTTRRTWLSRWRT